MSGELRSFEAEGTGDDVAFAFTVADALPADLAALVGPD